MNYVAVCLGGFVGAVSRYYLQLYLNKLFPMRTIPLSIFIINVIGSFVLGVLFPVQDLLQASWKLFFLTGLLGAFTTFSSFSLDTVFLIEQHGYKKACIFVFISIVGCIFSFFLGNVVVL